MPTVPNLLMNDGRLIPQIGFGVWQVPDDIVVDATLTAFAAGCVKNLVHNLVHNLVWIVAVGIFWNIGVISVQ